MKYATQTIKAPFYSGWCAVDILACNPLATSAHNLPRIYISRFAAELWLSPTELGFEKSHNGRFA